MRISDWSSDVCCSDLRALRQQCGRWRRKIVNGNGKGRPEKTKKSATGRIGCACSKLIRTAFDRPKGWGQGNSVDRKSVGEGKSVSVSVDLGGRRRIKQK